MGELELEALCFPEKPSKDLVRLMRVSRRQRLKKQLRLRASFASENAVEKRLNRVFLSLVREPVFANE